MALTDSSSEFLRRLGGPTSRQIAMDASATKLADEKRKTEAASIYSQGVNTGIIKEDGKGNFEGIDYDKLFEQDKTDNAYDEKYDPALHNSCPKSNRTIEKDWIEKKSDAYPTCCVYKNCSIDFRVWGITNKAEKYCMEFQLGVFNRVAGMAFCAMDQYIDLSMEDVMKMWINNHKVLKELRDKRLAASESENDNNTTSDNNQNANSKPSVSDTTTKETSQ